MRIAPCWIPVSKIFRPRQIATALHPYQSSKALSSEDLSRRQTTRFPDMDAPFRPSQSDPLHSLNVPRSPLLLQESSNSPQCPRGSHVFRKGHLEDMGLRLHVRVGSNALASAALCDKQYPSRVAWPKFKKIPRQPIRKVLARLHESRSKCICHMPLLKSVKIRRKQTRLCEYNRIWMREKLFGAEQLTAF